MSTRLFHYITPRVRTLVATFTCALCILIAVLASTAIAHALGQSYLYFQIGDKALDARVEVTVQDLNEALQLGLPDRRRIPPSQIEPHLEQIKAYVASHLTVGDSSQAYDLVFQNHTFLTTTFARFLQLNYAIEGLQTLPDSLQVTYDVILTEKPEHTNLVLIEQNWRTGTFANESNASLIVADAGQTQTLILPSGSLIQGFWGLLKISVGHLLKGADHFLFLAALLLPSVLRRDKQPWQPVGSLKTPFLYALKLVTVFTLVHTVGLGLATLQGVSAPPRLVESVTAAAIGLASVEIFAPVFKGWIVLIAAVFGLFHGFGIAEEVIKSGALSLYPIFSLFSFNLGIELGQIGIVAVMVSLLYLVRKQWFYPRYVMQTGGVLLGAMSLYWFIEHVFNVNIQVLPFIQGLLGVVSYG